MQPYFDTPELREAIIREACSWIGTPFILRARQKRFGVDCVGLPICCYRETGLFGSIEVPRYTISGGHQAGQSPLIRTIEDLGCFVRIWERQAGLEAMPVLAPGDLLTMKLGRTPFHAGLMFSPTRFVHALDPAGVVESDLGDWTYRKLIQAVYRPVVRESQPVQEVTR